MVGPVKILVIVLQQAVFKIISLSYVGFPLRISQDIDGEIHKKDRGTGSGGRARTCDLVVNSHPLYH